MTLAGLAQQHGQPTVQHAGDGQGDQAGCCRDWENSGKFVVVAAVAVVHCQERSDDSLDEQVESADELVESALEQELTEAAWGIWRSCSEIGRAHV